MTQHSEHGAERAQRLIAMGEMAASLAHEIRNPLGSMELFCSLLKRDLHTQPKLFEIADQIHVGIRRLERIISNCLQFAKDLRPKIKVYPSVSPILAEVLQCVESRAQESQVTVTPEIIRDGDIAVDSFLFIQAVVNLTSNAIDATETVSKEGSRPHVILRAECCDNSSWKISVIDRGVGIAKEDLEKIFDPFFTTKQEGTGLGLAIVHSIIRAHGGELKVASEAGKGTTMTIELPAAGVLGPNQGER